MSGLGDLGGAEGDDDELPSMDEAQATVEYASVLFLGRVRESDEGVVEEAQMTGRLQVLVRETQEYRRAQKANTLVAAPAEGGFALAFLGGDLAAPLRCAIQLTKSLNGSKWSIKVRMGIHSGAVCRYRDTLNNLLSLAGPGVKSAARVGDFGDDRHILVSEETAALLREDSKWRPHFHPLGLAGAKPDRKVCNFYFSDVGNQSTPTKIADADGGGVTARAETPAPHANRETPRPDVAPRPPVRGTPIRPGIDEDAARPGTDEAQPAGGRRAPAPTAPASTAPPVAVDTGVEPGPKGRPLVTRVIGVSYTKVSGEALLYAPQMAGDDDAVCPPVAQRIQSLELRNHLMAFQKVVKELTLRAVDRDGSRDRGGLDVEPAAAAIARHVLPPQGLARLVGMGVHPQLQLLQDIAGQIPWEALEETYYVCAECGREVLPLEPPEGGVLFCQRHPVRMQPTLGKLATELQLSHLVPGRQPPGARGRRFVILEDPTGDLCYREDSKSTHAIDPQRVCANHIGELKGLLEEIGYEVDRYPRTAATVERLEGALKDPSVVGIYFFGHGSIEEGEGYLRLADQTFSAGRFKDLQATTPFVFLNACEGAGAGEGWNLEEQPRSVAAALAAPGHWRTVVAPIWPVVNVQAAATALAFFRAAAEMSLGEAMQVARRASLDRYRGGAPDLSWFVYRFFGNPRRCLPKAEIAVAKLDRKLVAMAESRSVDRIFDASDQLDAGVFGFGIENVLMRAAQRRNGQRRARVSVADFIVGLVSQGDLTRYILSRGEARDLDEDLQALAGPLPGEEPGTTAPELGSLAADGVADSAPGGADSVRRGFRERKELESELVKLLGAADREAQGRPGADQRISERDVLVHVTADARWDDLVDRVNLRDFKAQELRAAVEAVILEKSVDENGQVPLGRLGPEARSIVETAHGLAQQRGARSISNRLLLAAFLKEPKGEAARRCRARKLAPDVEKHDPEEIFAIILASSEGQQPDVASPRAFGLSSEMCERIVEPVLQAARAASPWEPVSEACLLRAFCECARPDFKSWLVDLVGLDLDGLASGPEQVDDLAGGPAFMAKLDPSAKRIIRTAHKMSQQIGSFPIRNAVLLAAFLQDEASFAVHLLPPGLRFQAARDWLIRRTAIPGRAAHNFPLDDEACERAIKPAVDRALEMRTDDSVLVNEVMLLIAFCQAAPPELHRALAKGQFGLDLSVLVFNFFKQMAVGPEAQEAGNDGGETTRPPPAPPPPSPPPDVTVELPTGLAQSDLDDDVWAGVVGAALLAREQGWTEIRSPHLFASMLHRHIPVTRDGPLPPEQEKDLIRAVLSLVPRQPGPAPPPAGPVRVSRNAGVALERAIRRARAAGRARATMGDLIEGFFEDGGGAVGELLHALRGGGGRGGLVAGAPPGATVALSQRPGAEAALQPGGAGGGSVLGALGIDLTEKARKGQIPEIVGRDAEIDAAMRSLLLSENANPLLVGDTGVGKTAIVEGLARRIALGPCPKKLEGTRIVEIQAGSLVANTRFRGEFEQRVQSLLAEARGNVVLFIDEIHSLIGAGASEGGGPDAGDLIKAALARGELRLIGATTHAEHRQSIARDKALSRRFQMQMIGPPSRDATLRILSARQPDLEKYHGVVISEDAKAAAVDLSGRYILDRQWPAKARDALEQACVLVESQGVAMAGTAPVTADHVAAVVSRITGIPLERLSASEMASLDTLAARLDRRIVGQTEATRLLVEAIRAGRQGLSTAHKPAGVFLFVGPPGVGKTELAKVLAEEVYGGADGLIRLDMGEFTEAHAVAKLTGSPPGYVGYREGARLVEALRRRPYSVLLLDEIEHAHEDVLAVFLRLFSEGTIADQDGNVADGRNAIVILTSNVVAIEPERGGVGFARAEPAAPAFGQSQATLRLAAEKHLPKKLIDRLDAIIRFRSLSPGDLEVIAAERLASLIASARSGHGLTVTIGPELSLWLARRAAEADSGAARAIARIVDEHVGKPLAAWLGRARPRPGGRAIVRLGAGGVEIVEG